MNARAFALALLLAASGCASQTDAPASDEGDSEAEIRASCTNPKRYYVVSADGPCHAVTTSAGTWTPEADPVFADVPASSKVTTCVIRWTSASNAPADRQALVDAYGYQAGLAPACGAGASPSIGVVREAPPPNVILGGSVGCDVCGILHDGHIWVVVPPDRLARSFEAPLTNGTTKSFAIDPSSSPALSIQLPAPPAGTKYVDGVVKLD